MNKKGAEGFLWLKVLYFVLALIIVVITYQFISSKLSSTLFLGYASREIGMNIDIANAAPGGRLVIGEDFEQPLYLDVKNGRVNVKSAISNKTLDYGFYSENVAYDSGKNAVQRVEIVNDHGGVSLNGR